MKQGFLSSTVPSETAPAQQSSDGTSGAGSEQSSSSAASQPAKPTAEQASASLQQCLQLLKGPSDEKRFVGLLLVTKLLPAGDDNTIRAVYKAIGSRFLQRLLLPLQSQQGREAAPADAEGIQKQRATCELALAVLSSICRVPELAQAGDVVDKVPLLIKVVKSGGLARLLQHSGATQPPPAEGAASDAAAVQDALECLTAIATAGQEGRLVCLESQGIQAASAALQAAVRDNAAWRGLPMQWLATLVAAAQTVPSILEEGCQALADAVPALAQLLSAPASVPTSPKAAMPQASHAAKAGAQPAPGPTASPAGAMGAVDPLALQLEALHVLLLIFSLASTQAPEVQELLSESGWEAPGGWPAAVRRGLKLLLSSRIGVVQRQAALGLAAAASQLLPPDWLLEPAGAQVNGSDEFFRLLVEVLKIEVNISLQDALWPTARVPSAAQPGVSAADYQAPLSSFTGTGKEESDDEEEGDLGGAGFGHTGSTAAGPALFGGAATAAATKYGDDPMVLAAIRALGRYLVEIPEAFPDRVRKLLPFMLSVGDGAAHDFLLPALMQTSHADAVAAGPHSAPYDTWLSSLMEANNIAA
ncbi:hypothetical protein WJX72_011255 [[Myrmecia] bisecta]|uniref:Neurochondrin n=1 Tax=[Myrmecia] bisecta TaxID=41462 RepID=A0AAW1R9M4_9CHLO